MAPVVVITVPCNQSPCNISAAYLDLVNLTSIGGPTTADPQADYDHQGAARFIIATVLVYSLMGVLGTLLLRIKRSASRSRRIVNVREESVHKYMKHSKHLSMRGRRDVLRRETERFIDRMQSLGQDPSTGTPLPSSHQVPTAPKKVRADKRPPHSPSISLLMPLLHTMPESPETAGTPTPTLVYHLPFLSPITLPETSVTSSSSPSIITNNTEGQTSFVTVNYHPLMPFASRSDISTSSSQLPDNSREANND